MARDIEIVVRARDEATAVLSGIQQRIMGQFKTAEGTQPGFAAAMQKQFESSTAAMSRNFEVRREMQTAGGAMADLSNVNMAAALQMEQNSKAVADLGESFRRTGPEVDQFSARFGRLSTAMGLGALKARVWGGYLRTAADVASIGMALLARDFKKVDELARGLPMGLGAVYSSLKDLMLGISGIGREIDKLNKKKIKIETELAHGKGFDELAAAAAKALKSPGVQHREEAEAKVAKMLADAAAGGLAVRDRVRFDQLPAEKREDLEKRFGRFMPGTMIETVRAPQYVLDAVENVWKGLEIELKKLEDKEREAANAVRVERMERAGTRMAKEIEDSGNEQAALRALYAGEAAERRRIAALRPAGPGEPLISAFMSRAPGQDPTLAELKSLNSNVVKETVEIRRLREHWEKMKEIVVEEAGLK